MALKYRDLDLGQPWGVRWCSQTSSLVLVHIRGSVYCLSRCHVTLVDALPVNVKQEPMGEENANEAGCAVVVDGHRTECMAHVSFLTVLTDGDIVVCAKEKVR